MMALTDMVLMPGTDYQNICDQTRRLTGETATLTSSEVVTKLSGVTVGGGDTPAVSPKDINFYDYDGTCVEAWALSELSGKTTLPDYPVHAGLTCQGWNWSLDDLKSQNTKMNVGAMYITTDGKTRIYISLHEGRTSPMLGVAPNGTVTVDWGDGTTPDTLTGTSLNSVKWTPKHNYAAPGDYVITLTVSGEMSISGNQNYSNLLCYSSERDNRNGVYLTSIQKIHVGANVRIYSAAFADCYGLTGVTLPSTITSIASYAFQYCERLPFVTLPSGISKIGDDSCNSCSALIAIAIPNGVTQINATAFQSCYNLTAITIPNGVERIWDTAFQNCNAIASVSVPGSVSDIRKNAFAYCRGASFYDFTTHATVPTLGTGAFAGLPADCEIRVPAALLDEWKAATNWATYANQIVGV